MTNETEKPKEPAGQVDRVVSVREPSILPVKPGSISVKDKAALKRVGVIVIEHDNPEELRLLRPTVDMSAGDMLQCAMRALTSKVGISSEGQRQEFTKLMAAVVMSRVAR